MVIRQCKLLILGLVRYIAYRGLLHAGALSIEGGVCKTVYDLGGSVVIRDTVGWTLAETCVLGQIE